MNQLKNSFSLLELDVADDTKQTAATTAAADLRESTNGRGKGKKKGDGLGDTTIKKKGDGSGDTTLKKKGDGSGDTTIKKKGDGSGDTTLEKKGDGSGDTTIKKKGDGSGDTTPKKKGDGSGDTTISKNDNRGQQCLEMVSGDCKLPLVWIDLEMTGLNVEVDRILELACVVTDGNLTKSFEGPDLVIHQSKACLDRMGEWCQTHHAASGLTKKVLRSAISEQEAEKQVIEFVKRHVGTYTPLLAGNSVYMDFLFLKKYMPDLASLFSHVLVDVSSLKALCLRWYPKENRNAPSKENKHRAMDDIKESIAELKYYKENIFKSPKSKK